MPVAPVPLLSKGLIAGVVLSLAILALFAARMDWGEFMGALATVEWPWIAAGCAGLALTISLRAVRWAAISGAYSVVGGYWNATAVGYAGNTLLPGRAGEVLRIAALYKSLRVPPGQSVATALMDRMADLVALGAVAAYAGVYITALSSDALVQLVIALMLVPVLGFFVVLAMGARFEPLIGRLCARLSGEWSERLPRWYAQALEACRALGRRNRWVGVAALTVAAYSIDYTVLWLFLQAFAWQLPLGAAVTVGVLLAIGSLLPAAPGYLGIYQAACVIGLAPYGVGESAALAYSVVAQGATVLMVAVLGVIATIRYRWGAGIWSRDTR